MREKSPENAESAARRVVILRVLIAVYVLVSIVAYTDYPRDAAVTTLGDLERKGLSIWRDKNCQACHQIYGFGGFLGPDLTNRVTETTPDTEFIAILTAGSGRMPEFELEPPDQEALLAFLRKVHESGQSQPTPLRDRRTLPPREHFMQLALEWGRRNGSVPEDIHRACETWTEAACGVCHIPFTVGKALAVDVSARAYDRSVETLGEIVLAGRRRMPAFDATPAQIEELSTFLHWVTKNRDELVEVNEDLLDRESFSWSALPWFEYR